MINQLLKTNWNVDIYDSKVESPIMLATSKGMLSVVKDLHRRGVQLSGINLKGDTLLHLAAKADALDLI